MADFPTDIQTLPTNTTGSEPLSQAPHSNLHNTVNEVVNALQEKLGIDGSTNVDTIDYLLKSILSIDPGHKHTAASLIGISGGGGSGGTKLVLNTTENTVTGTVSDTPIFTEPIPADTLGTNNAIRVTFSGVFTPGGAGTNSILRVKYGGQTVATFNTGNSSTDGRSVIIQGMIMADNDTGAQKTEFIILTATGQTHREINTATVDSTTNQNVVISAENDDAADTMLGDSILIEEIAAGSSNNIDTYTSKPVALTGSGTSTPTSLNDNTVMSIGLLNIPQQIILSKLSAYIQSFASAGTFDYVIYSEDGQTQLLVVTSGTISGSGVVDTTTFSPITLPAGNYYVGVHPNGSASFGLRSVVLDNLSLVPTGGAVLAGLVTIPASTTPATIDPDTDITFNLYAVALIRFDA